MKRFWRAPWLAEQSPERRPARRVWRLGVVVALCVWWLSGLAVAWLALAPMHRAEPATPIGGGIRSFENVELRSADGVRLAGWLIPARGRARAVVIGCHGIGSDRTSLIPFARTMSRRGYDVLLFDFRARGRSGGSRCTIGYRETDDVLAAVAWAGAHPPTRGLPIALYGQSMGAASAILAAARSPQVRAVVAESPFSRLDRAVALWFRRLAGPLGPAIAAPSVWWGEKLLGCRLRDVSPEDAMRRLSDCPVLLIQDAEDRQSPASETDRLLRASGGRASRWTAPGADHLCAQAVAPREFERRVATFLDDAIGR